VHDHTNIKFPNLEMSSGSWKVSREFIKKLRYMYNKAVRFFETPFQEALVCFNTAWNEKAMVDNNILSSRRNILVFGYNRRYQNEDTKGSIVLIYTLFQKAPRELWISHNCLLWTSQEIMNLTRLLAAGKPNLVSRQKVRWNWVIFWGFMYP
jgi:hypothetical protein